MLKHRVFLQGASLTRAPLGANLLTLSMIKIALRSSLQAFFAASIILITCPAVDAGQLSLINDSFVPVDTIVSDPNSDLRDFEFDIQGASLTWQDDKGKLWLGKLYSFRLISRSLF